MVCAVRRTESSSGEGTSAASSAAVQPDEGWLETWTEPELREWQRSDPDIGYVIECLEASAVRPPWTQVAGSSVARKHFWSIWDSFILDNGILKRRYSSKDGGAPFHVQVVAPAEVRSRLLRSLHSGPTGAHLGRNKLFDRVRHRVYWMGYKEDVARWCRECDICAQAKPGPRRKRAPMGQVLVSAPLERIAVDIMGPLPETTDGFKYILVLGDYFTKWTEAYALKDHTAYTVAEHLIQRFFCRFGLPRQIHSDHRPEFVSELIRCLCELLRIKKTRTVPYNPKSDGMVERFNRTVQGMLKTLVNDAQNDWDHHLPFVMMAYRASVHESTKCTPNLLMLGRETNLPVDLMFGSPPEQPVCPVEYVEWVRLATQHAFEFVERTAQLSSARQKSLYDRNSGSPRFLVGDSVWRFYPPKARTKFGKGWQGPFLVVGKVNDLVYSIRKSPASHTLHVHVDHLKAYEGRCPVRNWLVDQLDSSNDDSGDEEGEVDPFAVNSSPVPGDNEKFPNKSTKRATPPLVASSPQAESIEDFSVSDDFSPVAVPPSNITAFPSSRLVDNIDDSVVRRSSRPRKPKLDVLYEYY